jgi:formate dehydrogenase subunit delta
MEDSVMVHKANSIAQFFAAYPRDEAVAGVAKHIRLFWEPRMRRQLEGYIAHGGTGLHELVQEAAKQLPPVEKETLRGLETRGLPGTKSAFAD